MMKVLIDINHPADVHLFKNVILKLEKKNHEFCIVARDKECTLQLLDNYGLKYIKRKGYKGLLGKTLGILFIDLKLLRISKKFKPDILIGSAGNVYIPTTAKILNKPSLIFEDTEHNKKALMLIKRFATKIYTPTYFSKDLGPKQVRYNGHHELAYLSPKYFRPDSSVLKKLGMTKGKAFFIIRLVSWEAIHDKGEHGINDKIRIIKTLEKHGKVFISSEGKLPVNLETYRVKLSPEEIHSALYYSTLFIGEGATMASECATLGIPAIYTNTLKLGYIDELERLGLIFSANTDTEVLSLVNKILKQRKSIYLSRLKKMLADKIDVTEFVTKEILRYAK